jgi:hypothetical protein
VSAITGRKFVSYLGLIPVLIEAIKEQQAQIAELRDSGQNTMIMTWEALV